VYLPLPSAFQVQPLFQFTKKVVRVLLFALCFAFLPEQDYDSTKIYLCELTSKAL